MKLTNHYISLIFQKAYADLVSETRRGYLGILWWIIEPILYMSVFYIMFALLFNKGGKGTVVFLLTGLVIWKWFDTSVRMSADSLITNIGLINQVYIPKIVFPAMVVTTCTIKFFIIFPLLVIFLIITGYDPNITWVSLPIIMFVQLLLIFMIGGLLAAIVPFVPDFRLMIDNGMTLLFFMSGVFFDLSAVSPQLKMYLYLNPMVGIIESYRTVLINGGWPDWTLLGLILIVSVVGLLVMKAILNHFDRVYAKII